MAGRLLLGTSGFSYDDWRGGFYPPNLPARDMLAHYAREFQACELNASYYRLPTVAGTAGLLKKSAGRVTFVVKAHQRMTHARDAPSADYAALASALEPLRAAGRLGGILAQFPYSFPNTLANRGYLADLRARCEPLGAPLIVEFRHRSWVRPEVPEFLRGLDVCVVNVDEPALHGLLPPSDLLTGAVGYVRFHGRNREKWFQRGGQPWERYDYLYSEAELREWVPRIRSLAERAAATFVFFNNHWQSQAVVNARQMAGLLGMGASPPAGNGPAAPRLESGPGAGGPA